MYQKTKTRQNLIFGFLKNDNESVIKKEKGTYLRYEHCKSNNHNGEFSLGYGIINPANDHNDDFSLGYGIKTSC